MNPTPPPRRRSPLAGPRLLLPLAVLVLGVGYYAFTAWRGAADRAASARELLEEVHKEIAKSEPDGNELSRLMAGLKKLPDHGTAPELLAAQAEIELARDRPERAESLFANVAARPGAAPSQQRLGARILLRRQEGYTGDASQARGLLQQVAAYAERAYADSHDPADLLMVWQARQRLGERAEAEAAAARLRAEHADAPAAKLVALAASFDPARSGPALNALAADFDRPPVEIAAMQCLVVLQSGEVPRAIEMAEANLRTAPSVPVVRFAAALVFHACALASAAGSTDRDGWLARRDAQLDWLDERAVPDDPQRASWRALRQQR